MALRFLTFSLGVLSIFLLLWALEMACTLSDAKANPAYKCLPTAEDEMGPLYKPGAPQRHSVGEGYLLIGEVKSAADCSPLPGAQIEIWLAGPGGLYGEAWRATLFSSDKGTYYFTSHVPPNYGTGRPHIHIKVAADKYRELVTQHYPKDGTGMAVFDLVLVPYNDKNKKPHN